MRPSARLLALAGALAATAALAPAASALVDPVKVANLRTPTSVVETRKGTSLVLAFSTYSGWPTLFRRTARGTSWTKVSIPHLATLNAVISQLPSGELRIWAREQSVTVVGKLDVLRSTDDGAHWSAMDTSAWTPGGARGVTDIQLYGPSVAYVQRTAGGPAVVRIHDDLGGYDVLPGFPQRGGVTGDGTAVTVAGATNALHVTAGAHALDVPFPCQPDTLSPEVAYGTHRAVVIARCPRAVYAFTVSTGGVATTPKRVDVIPANVVYPDLRAGAGPNDAFVVAWQHGRSGDAHIATASGAGAFRVRAGVVPIADMGSRPAAWALAGTAWALAERREGGAIGNLWAAPLTRTVTPPRAPTRGLSHPVVVRSGTAVAAMAGVLPYASLRKTARVTVRLLAATDETVTVTIRTGRPSQATMYTGGKKVKIRGGRLTTLVITLSGGGIVVGGSSGTTLDQLRHRDTVTLTLSARDGDGTGVGRVS